VLADEHRLSFRLLRCSLSVYTHLLSKSMCSGGITSRTGIGIHRKSSLQFSVLFYGYVRYVLQPLEYKSPVYNARQPRNGESYKCVPPSQYLPEGCEYIIL